MICSRINKNPRHFDRSWKLDPPGVRYFAEKVILVWAGVVLIVTGAMPVGAQTILSPEVQITDTVVQQSFGEAVFSPWAAARAQSMTTAKLLSAFLAFVISVPDPASAGSVEGAGSIAFADVASLSVRADSGPEQLQPLFAEFPERFGFSLDARAFSRIEKWVDSVRKTVAAVFPHLTPRERELYTAVFLAQIYVESGGLPTAQSALKKDPAKGLFQVRGNTGWEVFSQLKRDRPDLYRTINQRAKKIIGGSHIGKRHIGRLLKDPDINLVIGMRVMKAALDEFDGNMAKALAAHNMGLYRAKRRLRDGVSFDAVIAWFRKNNQGPYPAKILSYAERFHQQLRRLTPASYSVPDPLISRAVDYADQRTAGTRRISFSL